MATPTPGLVLLTPDEVRPSPNNPRKTLDGIEDLAASIAQVGLLQPIVVQRAVGPDGRVFYEVVAGHRRLAAMKLLCKREIPAIIRKPLDDAAALVARFVENDQRAPLDPIEEAHALRAIQHGTTPALTQAQVAAKVGRSLTSVSTRLALLELPVEEQEKVRSGHYTANYALGLVREFREQRRPKTTDGAPRPVGRPKGSKTKPYFGDTHPLAEAARTRCGSLRHGKGHIKVGGVACGPCWEHALRADERANPTDIPTDLEETA